MIFGSTIASWTLSVGPVSRFICSHINYMRNHNYSRIVVPRDPTIQPVPVTKLKSNYVKRATQFPKAGHRPPWCYYHDFLNIIKTFFFSRFDNNVKYYK